ncbi:MAG: 16S rRNA (uracil(1498)-N(3))-methyltransferase [Pseudomonadota bacterium]
MDRNSTPKIRLYVDHPLGQGQSVPLSRAQAHYLFGVMRLGVGAVVKLFNGRDGEWQATVVEAAKRGGVLDVTEQTAPQKTPPDVWLAFAPIKKARTDFIVEKAVEMGVSRLLPVQTDFTNAGRIQRERLQAHAVEAAEQCGAHVVPEVCEMVRLDRLLSDWDATRAIMFCDEGLAGSTPELPSGGKSWAVFIGPEGGFSPRERARLTGLDVAHPVALGPRILRADTAAVAALSLWQMRLGDW